MSDTTEIITLNEACERLSISTATGKNWVKLGKIIPCSQLDGIYYFNKADILNLKEELVSGKNTALKSRRNKKYVSGHGLYTSYVSENCQAVVHIQKLLALLSEKEVELNDQVISILLADCALHLLFHKKYPGKEVGNNLFSDFINGQFWVDERDTLVRELVGDVKEAGQLVKKYPLLFNIDYPYEEKEDILGLVYISCKNLANRKAIGAYYTSTKVVKKLVFRLPIKEKDTILDPCCGTGNFLLQLPNIVDYKNIYGQDIDVISVKIARLNLALRYDITDLDFLYEHITENNYLMETNTKKYSFIIGNPPWGYDFSEEENSFLRWKYECAKGKNIESYDVFIEEGLRNLEEGGELSFVLPEAFLTVKAHQFIREYLMKENSIRYIEYLGNAFDGVQCPCIIMETKRTGKPLSTMGMVVNTGEKEFIIGTNRDIWSDCFSFAITDEEAAIMDKIMHVPGASSLLGNADFALGIVTGNNKEFITSKKSASNEMILKGSDIYKYRFEPSDNYIVFEPERFQQVASTEKYRAEEKLLYRFISNQLVFAYDDKQTLSLNSCNLVIPRLADVSVKYILAILNSRVAQFLYQKKFNSLKVLRAHIESIPIPVVDQGIQDQIVSLVDTLIDGSIPAEKIEEQYNVIDGIIMELYGLTEAEATVVRDVAFVTRSALCHK